MRVELMSAAEQLSVQMTITNGRSAVELQGADLKISRRGLYIFRSCIIFLFLCDHHRSRVGRGLRIELKARLQCAQVIDYELELTRTY